MGNPQQRSANCPSGLVPESGMFTMPARAAISGVPGTALRVCHFISLNPHVHPMRSRLLFNLACLPLETVAQGSEVSCPGSHSWSRTELKFGRVILTPESESRLLQVLSLERVLCGFKHWRGSSGPEGSFWQVCRMDLSLSSL